MKKFRVEKISALIDVHNLYGIYLTRSLRGGWQLAIGCEKHTIPYWKERFDEIMKNHGVEKDEAREYKKYLRLAEKIQALIDKGAKE